MNKAEYRLLKTIIHTGENDLFILEHGTETVEMRHLVDLGHVAREYRMVDGNFTHQICVYRATPSGREAADDYRIQRNERLWTRGLAIVAILISIGSLIVSVIALRQS